MYIDVYLFINYLTKITFPNRTWKMIKTADLAYLQTTMVFVYLIVYIILAKYISTVRPVVPKP